MVGTSRKSPPKPRMRVSACCARSDIVRAGLAKTCFHIRPALSQPLGNMPPNLATLLGRQRIWWPCFFLIRIGFVEKLRKKNSPWNVNTEIYRRARQPRPLVLGTNIPRGIFQVHMRHTPSTETLKNDKFDFHSRDKTCIRYPIQGQYITISSTISYSHTGFSFFDLNFLTRFMRARQED